MRFGCWSLGLLMWTAVAPLACKTTKTKAPPAKAPAPTTTGDTSCAGQSLALVSQPEVDPGDLNFARFSAKSVSIAGKGGINSVAEFEFEIDPSKAVPDVLYVKACDKNSKVQEPLQCKGLDFVLRTPGDQEQRLAEGTYHLSAWPCVWTDRKKAGAKAAGFFEVTPADYPGRTLACGKAGLNKAVYLQDSQKDPELAKLMGEQLKARLEMHRSVYDMRGKLKQHYSKVSMAGAPELTQAFHSQAQNLVHMGETGNVMMVESDVYDRALLNSRTMLDKKKNEEASLGLAETTKACVTKADLEAITNPPVVPSNSSPVVVADPETNQEEPAPAPEPAPVVEEESAEPIDPLAEEREACNRRGPQFVFEDGRCWHEKPDGSVSEIVTSIDESQLPTPPAPAPQGKRVTRANEAGGITMITLGSIFLAGGAVATVQGARFWNAASKGGNGADGVFFRKGEVSFADYRGKAAVFSFASDKGNELSGRFIRSLGGSTDVKLGQRAVIGGAVSMAIGALFVGLGESLRNGSIGLASSSAGGDPAMQGTLDIVNPTAKRFNAIRSDYIARSKKIQARLGE